MDQPEPFKLMLFPHRRWVRSFFFLNIHHPLNVEYEVQVSSNEPFPKLVINSISFYPSVPFSRN